MREHIPNSGRRGGSLFSMAGVQHAADMSYVCCSASTRAIKTIYVESKSSKNRWVGQVPLEATRRRLDSKGCQNNTRAPRRCSIFFVKALNRSLALFASPEMQTDPLGYSAWGMNGELLDDNNLTDNR